MNRRLVLSNLLAVSVLCASPAPAQKADQARPDKWAKPVKAEGVPNFFQITTNLYRCAQPTEEGMKSLENMGIKTVINLRGFHSDEDELQKTSLTRESIRIDTWNLKESHVVKFLKLVTNSNNYPIAFHCQHGADRTGTMCAIYRVAVESWSKEEAIKEMTEGGYGYHSMWEYLLTFIRNLDIEAVRKKAGLDGKPSKEKDPETKK